MLKNTGNRRGVWIAACSLLAAFLCFSIYYLMSDPTDLLSERVQKVFGLVFNFSVAFLVSFLLIQGRQDRRKMVDVIDAHILKLEKKLDELLLLFENEDRYDFVDVMGKLRFINNEWRSVKNYLSNHQDASLAKDIKYVTENYTVLRLIHDNNVKQGKLDQQYVRDLKRIALLIEERLDSIRLRLYS